MIHRYCSTHGALCKRPAPARVGCDFCGLRFPPPRTHCRTCHRCAVAGAPDQSVLPWSQYWRALKAFLRAKGRLAPLSGAAALPHPHKPVHGRFRPRAPGCASDHEQGAW